MTRQNTTQTQQQTPTTNSLSRGGILQRKCESCGQHTIAGGECTECGKRKNGLQRQLTIGDSNDPLEREADRVANQMMAAPAHSVISNAPPRIQRYIGQTVESTDTAPASVDHVLSSPGKPLEPALQQDMGQRFGYDFSQVRVHTGAEAERSARELNANAYTVGHKIVFGVGRFSPATHSGRRLLAHELTHVVQQSSATASPATRIHRQLATPLAPGGGFGGLMDRDRAAVSALTTTPFHVCSRDLQGVLGLIGNHAYIEAPPFRYAIISPLCPSSWSDNPVTGTTAQKWDNSPDPCGKTPNCVPCNPRPGITDVAQCFRDAFTSYASLSLYKGTGPNSNTFAGTLARACCAGMIPKPSRLGNVPGWNDPPAPTRAGGTPCPPGPTC